MSNQQAKVKDDYFYNAQAAFEHLYDLINSFEASENGTKRILNYGFYIITPKEKMITTPWRKWNMDYALEEWAWYNYGDGNIDVIGQMAKRWQEVADDSNWVNSNYGYIWRDQLAGIIGLLNEDPFTRKASIQLFDHKSINTKDTICTYAINFKVIGGQLDMSVVMRSNDLWFGFCNDQFCFSMLQQKIAKALNLPVGKYYHFAQDLHLYKQHWDRHVSK